MLIYYSLNYLFTCNTKKKNFVNAVINFEDTNLIDKTKLFSNFFRDARTSCMWLNLGATEEFSKT